MALEDLDLLVSSTVNSINLDLSEVYYESLINDMRTFQVGIPFFSVFNPDF
jgi:hypothetical protein